jgi:hypothetical protein
MGDDFVRYGFPFIECGQRRQRPGDDQRNGKSHAVIAARS